MNIAHEFKCQQRNNCHRRSRGEVARTQREFEKLLNNRWLYYIFTRIMYLVYLLRENYERATYCDRLILTLEISSLGDRFFSNIFGFKRKTLISYNQLNVKI
jgi:hypothetical protein